MTRILSFLGLAVLLAACAAPAPKQPAVLDFGDYTSQTLTTNAWLALGDRNYEHAIQYADKCAELYVEEARKMQASLNAKAHIDEASKYWALNDVGTSYFIKGEALTRLGRKTEAIEAYKVVRDELTYAQAWDPKGWFWSPADAAYPKIKRLSKGN